MRFLGDVNHLLIAAGMHSSTGRSKLSFHPSRKVRLFVQMDYRINANVNNHHARARGLALFLVVIPLIHC